MPSFLNNLGASFLPQQRRPLINQNAFGFNTQLPRPMQDDSRAQTQQEAEDDFISKYGKIAGTRPNRLAYQQAVEEGAPEIHRGKWAKLGAMLAAGGAGLGGTPAPQAAQLGISAYETPQKSSDEAYKQKLTGLGNLAQFEDSDIQDKIKQLELERGEHWKSEENRRQNEELGIKKTDSQRAADLAKLQTDEIRDRMSRLDVEEYIDPATGVKYKKNMKTGDISQIGKVSLTSDEAAQAAGAKTKSEEGAKAPFESAHDARMAASNLAVAQEGTKRAESVAATNKEAKIQSARERNNAITKVLKPGEKTTKIWNDLTSAFAADPELAGEALEDYVTVVGQGSNQTIETLPEKTFGPFKTGDDERTAAIKKRIREIISGSLGSNTSAPAGTTTPPPASGWGKPIIRKGS